MNIATNMRNELISNKPYSIVNVNEEKTHAEITEIIYQKGMRIKRDYITFYLSGHNIDALSFVEKCLNKKLLIK
jgi:hypothetical protein